MHFAFFSRHVLGRALIPEAHKVFPDFGPGSRVSMLTQGSGHTGNTECRVSGGMIVFLNPLQIAGIAPRICKRRWGIRESGQMRRIRGPCVGFRWGNLARGSAQNS